MRIPISLILIDLYSACGMIGDEAFGIALSDSYRREEKNYYETILRNNFPRGNTIPHSDLTKDYLSRKYQDRNSYNRVTKICQKGLEKRLRNKEIKEVTKKINAENEKGIKEAFARKIKNKTHNKRHHSKNSNTY